jgi:hypothetical protein
MHRLKIALEPLLRERHGPEICWAWRTLLSSIGYAWEECSLDSPECDIAYTARAESAPTARIWIRADSTRWARKDAWRLERVAERDGWAVPIYVGMESEDRDTPMLAERRLSAPRDLIFDLFWLATGQEEPSIPRNKHGYLELEGTPWLSDATLQRALASGLGASLERALRDLGYPAPLPRWPYGKRAAACVTHDVDYPEVIRWLEPLRILARQRAAGLRNALDVAIGRRHHWHFQRWMELEQQLGTRSAFYFMARRGSLTEYALGRPDAFYDIRTPQLREVIRMLDAAGWEVGLHGSYEAYTSEAIFAAEKRRIESVVGHQLPGHRHHYWHMDPTNPEATLLIHERIGLRYDASLVNDHYLGWRRGISWPFFPFHQGERRELRTLQIPTAWMDDQLFGQHFRNPGDRQELLRGLVDRAAQQGGVMVADIHEYVFDHALFPGWMSTFRDTWRYIGQRGDFWLETPAHVAAHWAARYATIQRASLGLMSGSAIRATTDLPIALSLTATV